MGGHTGPAHAAVGSEDQYVPVFQGMGNRVDVLGGEADVAGPFRRRPGRDDFPAQLRQAIPYAGAQPQHVVLDSVDADVQQAVEGVVQDVYADPGLVARRKPAGIRSGNVRGGILPVGKISRGVPAHEGRIEFGHPFPVPVEYADAMYRHEPFVATRHDEVRVPRFDRNGPRGVGDVQAEQGVPAVHEIGQFRQGKTLAREVTDVAHVDHPGVLIYRFV